MLGSGKIPIGLTVGMHSMQYCSRQNAFGDGHTGVSPQEPQCRSSLHQCISWLQSINLCLLCDLFGLHECYMLFGYPVTYLLHPDEDQLFYILVCRVALGDVAVSAPQLGGRPRPMRTIDGHPVWKPTQTWVRA